MVVLVHHWRMIRAVTNASPLPGAQPSRAPDDRQAAIFSIVQALKTLELQEWTWTVMDWLRLYDGFEQFLPQQDDPVLASERVLARAHGRRTNDRVICSDVVKELEQLPFLRWHAQWLDASGEPVAPAWRPLAEPPVPFWQFAGQKPPGAAELRVAQRPTMHVESQAFRNWLIAGYLRFVLPRRTGG